MAVVSKLEDENRRLREQLSRNSDQNHRSDQSNSVETVSITREELLCIKNLTEENIRFKNILKAKEKDLARKALDMEAVRQRDEEKRNTIVNCFFSLSRFKLNLNVCVN